MQMKFRNNNKTKNKMKGQSKEQMIKEENTTTQLDYSS